MRSSAFRVKATVSIFHDRRTAQPGIVANVTRLGDYDDSQLDLIQSNKEKGHFGVQRERAMAQIGKKVKNIRLGSRPRG
jgi:hypothetical protein